MTTEGFNLHYGAAFTKPKMRSWRVIRIALDLYQRWQRKMSANLISMPKKKFVWHKLAYQIEESLISTGYGPGSSIVFLDDIPGPFTMELKPGERLGQFDEMAVLKEMYPDYDWDVEGKPSPKSSA